MRITIKDVIHPINRNISPSAKMLIIDEYIANPNVRSVAPIKILIGTAYRDIGNGLHEQAMRATPNQYIYEASLVIATDITARNFSIIKNRYGENCTGITSELFLNRKLKEIVNQMVVDSDYVIENIVTSIIQVIAVITGEPIFFINGKWKTHRDMWLDRNVLIKRRIYKHNFVDARVS